MENEALSELPLTSLQEGVPGRAGPLPSRAPSSPGREEHWGKQQTGLARGAFRHPAARLRAPAPPRPAAVTSPSAPPPQPWGTGVPSVGTLRKSSSPGAGECKESRGASRSVAARPGWAPSTPPLTQPGPGSPSAVGPGAAARPRSGAGTVAPGLQRARRRLAGA